MSGDRNEARQEAYRDTIALLTLLKETGGSIGFSVSQDAAIVRMGDFSYELNLNGCFFDEFLMAQLRERVTACLVHSYNALALKKRAMEAGGIA